jgi:hypothetical protein
MVEWASDQINNLSDLLSAFTAMVDRVPNSETVVFETPIRLCLVRETLSDGSDVYNVVARGIE